MRQVICQSDDRGHGFSRNENVLGGDCQPQPLFRIQQPEDLRLERKRQIAVSGTEPPCKISVRQLLPKAFFRTVADLFNAGTGKSVHCQRTCHIGDAGTVDQLIRLSGEGCRHEDHAVAFRQMPCNVLTGQLHAAGGKCSRFPTQGQYPIDHAGLYRPAKLLLAGVHDSPQGFVRFCGAAHIAESLLLVDLLQRQGQHFGAALMMPLTASLIFRAT